MVLDMVLKVINLFYLRATFVAKTKIIFEGQTTLNVLTLVYMEKPP